MNRQTLRDHLAQAERHVRKAQAIIARQSALIRTLQIDGHDTAEAARLLTEFERLLTIHMEHRDRIRSKLDSTPE